MTRISVVIPSYNGKHLIAKHLKSVFSVLESNDEVIIIDDASNDDTVEFLINNYKLSTTKTGITENIYSGKHQYSKNVINLVLIQQKINQRYAKSCNRGVLAANGSYILLLNNDVEPVYPIKNILLKHFHDKDVFAVGCLEYETSIGKNPSGKNLLFFKKGLFQHKKADNFEPGKTSWVSGGSGMFDKIKWLQLGGFDPRFYPAYWEDIDLSFRARNNGWKVLFDSKAIVLHLHETTNKTVFGKKQIEQMSWKNSFLFTKLHAQGFQVFSYYLWLPYWHWKRFKAL